MNLRARLACALAAVALVVALSGFGVLALVRESLIADLDHQLASATTLAVAASRQPFPGPRPGVVGQPPSSSLVGPSGLRLTELFVGQLSASGKISPAITPDLGSTATPDITVRAARANLSQPSRPRPFNTTSTDGRHGFRVVTMSGAGSTIVIALPTDRIDATYGRVRLGVLVVAATIVATAGLAGWWVQRLGLRPIKRLTDAAVAIADGDLERRADPTSTRTEVGQLAAAFNTMIDKRQEADQQLRTFVADASHELRTPLATVAGALELHSDGALDSVQLDETLRRARMETRRMTGLVNDLLELADLDRGVPLTIDTVDLGQLATDAAFDASITAPHRPITTRIDADPFVSGDEAKLRQVVANLLNNALFHTPDTTSIWLTVRRTGSTCRLEVSDDGPGLTTLQTQHVFDRFFRVDPGRTRAHGGAGLGLSIAQAITTAHHGTIAAEARVPRGVTFSVSLPAAAAPPWLAEAADGGPFKLSNP